MRLVLLVVLIGCGPPPDIAAQLADLPGVTVVEWAPPQDFKPLEGYRYFDLHFTQPLDHDHPEAGTFEQYATLMHKDTDAPLVVYTSGYGAGWKRALTEPATLLEANQLSLEYRFYATSRPAAPDWSLVDVHQNAEDEHHIYQLLADVYGGPTVQTGGSKGGENSLFHRMLHPEDLDAVVAYVAPVITDFPDLRYATVLDDIGLTDCRTALRALQREMLLRRAAMEAHSLGDAQYQIAGVAHAVETAVVELEFSFWMTRGEKACAQVPATTASDDDLYKFLVDTGGPAAYGDADLLEYGQQYIWQDHLELGYPVWEHAHLDDLLMYSYEDWSAYLPAPKPAYDPEAPRALAAWLASGPDHVIFVGGEWDPWSPGYPAIPTDDQTLVYTVAHGSHWSSGIYSVAADQRLTAVNTLRKWAHLAPVSSARLAPSPMGARDPRLRVE